MSYYMITFRIADRTVNGKTYDDRRQLLMENARTKDQGFWSEPTSFLLAQSSLDTTAFAKKVCAGLSSEYDLVFVFDPDDQSGHYFGAVAEPRVLEGFFPKVKKLL